MEKVSVICSLCGKTFLKAKIELHRRNFCCREHFYMWNSSRMTKYNRTENSMNKPGGVLESRIKRSEKLRNSSNNKGYRKLLGYHEHRRVAETMLGRPLCVGEVVHHIDGDKTNNSPDNLKVLASQAEHCRVHGFFRRKKGS